MKKDNNLKISILNSVQRKKKFINSTKEIVDWINNKNLNINFKIEKIPFKLLTEWSFCEKTGNIVHKKNGFFKIQGLNVKIEGKKNIEYEQFIVNQNEIGILGMITKEIDNTLYLLIQAKFEPGNINLFQLAPTFQATKSNYSQVHCGKIPEFFNYFITDLKNQHIISDNLQTEHNDFFLNKLNRNLVIVTNDEIEQNDNFKWLSIYQLKELLLIDNLVNMDVRSILSCIDYNKFLANKNDFSLKNIVQINSWINSFKIKNSNKNKLIDLKKIKNIKNNDNELRCLSNKNFEIIALNIEIDGRETNKWNQPIINLKSKMINIFIIKKINGVYHFLVQILLEVGSKTNYELGPTIKCYENEIKNVHFGKFILNDKVKKNILHSSIQSEEGGRFYHSENSYKIIKVYNNFNNEIPENFCWMTLNQINSFIKKGKIVDIQARTLLSLVSFEY